MANQSFLFRGLLATVLGVALTAAHAADASGTEVLPQKSGPPSTSDAAAPAMVAPSAGTSPSNTPLPAPEMIEVPDTSPAAVPLGPKLELALPHYAPPVLPATDLNAAALPGPRVFVKTFQFKGNTVFSSGTLAKVLVTYTGREISAEELEQARQALTVFYVDHGYINSGAILPDQDLKGGIVIFELIEGKLTDVNIKGNHWFQTWWLRNEIRQAAGEPLNFNHLKEGMQLLRENPTIAQVNAELQPGGAPGQSQLNMEVKDTQPFRASLEYANSRPPSVGSEIVNLHLADLNLTGNNDPLELTYGIAQSNSDSVEFSKLRNLDGSYTFPITPFHTTVQLRASKSDSSLVQAPFNTLNIVSRLTQYGGTLRQEIYANPRQELSFSLSADDRHSQTELLGMPFSLTPGSVNGVEDVFALRLIQEFVDRSQVHVLSLRSAFSVGLDVLGTTINANSPDGHFFTWLGQSQYIRKIGKTDNLLVLRLNGQIADRPLLSIEQFELGGGSTVRGYLENQALRDNGVLGSAELRFPVLPDKNHNAFVAIAPFFDVGVGWNNDPRNPSIPGSNTPPFDTQGVVLPSVGVGLIFTPTRYVNGEIYWGYALNREEIPGGHNLQNDGITFDLTVSAF